MQDIEFPGAITITQDLPHDLFIAYHSGLAHLLYHPHIHLSSRDEYLSSSLQQYNQTLCYFTNAARL